MQHGYVAVCRWFLYTYAVHAVLVAVDMRQHHQLHNHHESPARLYKVDFHYVTFEHNLKQVDTMPLADVPASNVANI